jgi:CheY-like chemotaxis protein
MGGDITVESKLNEGSTFIVTLVLDLKKNELNKKENKLLVDDDNNLFDGKNILLVEDNEINAEIATFMLKEHKFGVDRATNGKECLALIQEKGLSYYSAILMDIQMPIMNGYEATTKIRKLNNIYYQTIPIIALSANAYDEDIKKSFDAGMDAHLAKPFDVNELIGLLRKFIKS